MRKNFGKKNWLVPQPVLIITSYDEQNNPNAMNAAWGGMYDEHKIIICLSTEHKTTKNIILNKEFVVNFPSSKFAAESDYFGLESGNNIKDKINKAGLAIAKSEFVNAPIIINFPLSLDCKVFSIEEVDEGTTIVVAEILNASIDESMLGDKGDISSEKLDILLYDPIFHIYRKVGEKVDNAFSAGLKFKK